MSTIGWIVAAILIVSLLTFAAVLASRRRQSVGAEVMVIPALAPSLPASTPPLDPTGMFERSLQDVVGQGDLLVLRDPSDPGCVLVFGDRGRASTLGEIVGVVPGQLAAVAVGADALVKAGISMGESSGMLVRLTKESTQAMKELNVIKDAGGAAMGVLRDGSGHFRHVIRFNPAQGLQIASSLTGVIGAIAMQAQLAAIEKAIARLAEDVERVQVTLDQRADAELEAVEAVLQDVYGGARSTGVLTQAAWDQVAPMAMAVRQNAAFAEKRLTALLQGIHGKGSTGERRNWLREHDSDLLKAISSVVCADQTLVRYAALRLWWLTSIADPTLEHYTNELRELVDEQRQRRALIKTQVATALGDAGKTSRFDHVHSPFDSRDVKERTRKLETVLRENGLLPELSAAEPRPDSDLPPADGVENTESIAELDIVHEPIPNVELR